MIHFYVFVRTCIQCRLYALGPDHMESECKKAGGDKTSDVRLRDAAGLGRGEVDASKADSDEATGNAGCARRAEDQDIAIAVRERKHGNGRKDEERAEEQHPEEEK